MKILREYASCTHSRISFLRTSYTVQIQMYELKAEPLLSERI